MKKLLAVAVASLALTPLALAQGNVKAEITAVYTKAMSLIMKKDVDGLAKLMTPDMVMIAPGTPPMGRDAWVAQMKQVYPTLSGIKTGFTILSVKAAGKTAVVQLTQTFSATFKKDDGTSHKLEVEELSKDTVVHSGSTWLLKKSETLKHLEKIDGKVQTAPAPPPAPKKP